MKYKDLRDKNAKVTQERLLIGDLLKTGIRPEALQMNRGKNGKRWDAIISRIPIDEEWVGAEVGVWRGETCEKVLAQRPKVKLYLVDRWAPPVKGDSYSTSGAQIAAKDKKAHEDAYNQVVRLVKPFEDRATYLIGDTVPMAQKIANISLDFAFIDADHSYIGVYNDIIAYLPKVKLGGWLGGHDWNNKWPVEKAVLEFFPRNRITLDVNSTWFVTVTREDHALIKKLTNKEEEKNEPRDQSIELYSEESDDREESK
jgi:hypothetical protein